jgi:HlyD family secretion protein
VKKCIFLLDTPAGLGNIPTMLKKLVPILILAAVGLAVLIVFQIRKNSENGNLLSGSGTIEATEVELSSKLAGRIEFIAKEEGDTVSKGELLAQLEHRELTAQLRVAEATVRVTGSQIAQAKTTLKNLEDNLKRVESLFKSGSATQQQLEDIQTKTEAGREQLQSLEFSRQQAEAQKNLILTQIEAAKIFAPISGRVIKKTAEVGETVFPGSPVLTVADLTQVTLKIYLKETEAGRVQLGQSAKIRVDSYPDREFEGKVSFISPVAEFTPKNIQTADERVKLVFAVKLTIPNREEKLKPGLPADAEIVLAAP